MGLKRLINSTPQLAGFGQEADRSLAQLLELAAS
jgi:hypothetical protein